MKIFIKGISTVFSYFSRLVFYAVLAVLSGYAVANTDVPVMANKVCNNGVWVEKDGERE